MLRLIGVAFLVAGSTGIGYCLCADMKKRLWGLTEVKRLFEIIYSQVDYTGEALPEICRFAVKQLKPPFDSMLQAIYEETRKNTGKPFPQIWEEKSTVFLKEIPMKEEEKKRIIQFAWNFGYADRNLQKQTIAGQIGWLEEKIRETKERMAEKEKIYMSFGIMGGLLFAVILL